MALALEVQKEGWKGAYVKEYLAIGEVPETIRNAFLQKSRWCKGGMQIFLSKHNAALASNLSLMQRIVWNTSGWSYICTTVTTPVFLVLLFNSQVLKNPKSKLSAYQNQSVFPNPYRIFCVAESIPQALTCTYLAWHRSSCQVILLVKYASAPHR